MFFHEINVQLKSRSMKFTPHVPNHVLIEKHVGGVKPCAFTHAYEICVFSVVFRCEVDFERVDCDMQLSMLHSPPLLDKPTTLS